MSVERLQKILSQAGVASRRASERLMLEGRVTVNGATVTELGTKADPLQDDIRADGRRIKLPDRHRYLLLNKPRGYVTTRSDPEKRPTVIDLVGIREYIYPVGRLDFDSEGLLLLTNDGDLAAHLTHPRHGVERVYRARVLGVPDEHDLERLRRGIVIDGRRTAPAEVTMVRDGPSPGARHHSPGRAGPHPRASLGLERRLSASGEGRADPPHPTASLRQAQARPEPGRGSRVSRTRGPEAGGGGVPRTSRKEGGATLIVTVREGKNRQVRKMLDAIGHPVDRLERVAIGPIRDSRLKPGQWRDLTPEEVKKLRTSAQATVPRRREGPEQKTGKKS
jgi:23S rRNA pseudouridine2605 synthase